MRGARRRLSSLAAIPFRDVASIVRYGRHAPRWGRRIWVPPAACTGWIRGFPSVQSGRVIAGDWDLEVERTIDHPDVAAAVAHWRDGISWEQAGVYARLARRIAAYGGVRDGCLTHDDIVARFDDLDRMFEQVKREQQLRSSADLHRWCIWERDGVLVHIDRHGTPHFGGRGCHRLAAAWVADLPCIPAQLGVVHPDGLRHLPRYMTST